MPKISWERLSQQKHAWEGIRDKAGKLFKFAQNQIDGIDRIVEENEYEGNAREDNPGSAKEG